MVTTGDLIKRIVFPISTLTYLPQIKKLSTPPSKDYQILPTSTNDIGTPSKPVAQKSGFSPLIPIILTIAHTVRLLGWFLGGDVKLEIGEGQRAEAKL